MDGDISPELFQLSEPAAVDRRSRTIGLVSSAVAAIGSFLPWASVGPFTVNGTSGDGVITLVIAAVAAVFAFRLPKGRGARMVTLIGALLIAAIGIYDIVNISNQSDEIFAASVGIGIVITTIGGLGLLAASLMAGSDRT